MPDQTHILTTTNNNSVTKTLPEIPDKIYFTIGEVSDLCNLKPHVLRYWEQEFSQLAPAKRRGNRRYYQREDVLMIREIRSLLYDQGYTIKAARRQLSQQQKAKTVTDNRAQDALQKTITDLEEILADLSEI